MLVHGLGASSLTWHRVAAELLGGGYTVLRYDFYDRGYSEADPTRYPVDMYNISHSLECTIEQ